MKHLFRSFFSYIRSNPVNTLIVLFFVIAIAGLIRLHLKTQIDDNWEQFKLEHHCQVIEARGGNNVRSGWICDDENEYYRWRQQL